MEFEKIDWLPILKAHNKYYLGAKITYSFKKSLKNDSLYYLTLFFNGEFRKNYLKNLVKEERPSALFFVDPKNLRRWFVKFIPYSYQFRNDVDRRSIYFGTFNTGKYSENEKRGFKILVPLRKDVFQNLFLEKNFKKEISRNLCKFTEIEEGFVIEPDPSTFDFGAYTGVL